MSKSWAQIVEHSLGFTPVVETSKKEAGTFISSPWNQRKTEMKKKKLIFAWQSYLYFLPMLSRWNKCTRTERSFSTSSLFLILTWTFLHHGQRNSTCCFKRASEDAPLPPSQGYFSLTWENPTSSPFFYFIFFISDILHWTAGLLQHHLFFFSPFIFFQIQKKNIKN